MTLDRKKRCKEAVRQGEVRESTAPPGESLEKKKVRFSTEVGAGGASGITVEEQVEDYWSDEHGQGELFEGLHNRNQTWTRRPPRLRWIVCWQMELCGTFFEVMALV